MSLRSSVNLKHENCEKTRPKHIIVEMMKTNREVLKISQGESHSIQCVLSEIRCHINSGDWKQWNNILKAVEGTSQVRTVSRGKIYLKMNKIFRQTEAEGNYCQQISTTGIGKAFFF